MSRFRLSTVHGSEVLTGEFPITLEDGPPDVVLWEGRPFVRMLQASTRACEEYAEATSWTIEGPEGERDPRSDRLDARVRR